jgi:hypothetical protein
MTRARSAYWSFSFSYLAPRSRRKYLNRLHNAEHEPTVRAVDGGSQEGEQLAEDGPRAGDGEAVAETPGEADEDDDELVPEELYACSMCLSRRVSVRRSQVGWT